MTVVDNHTCFSSVVIKVGAICVAVDVVVERFDFFVIFLFWNVHSKVRVEVISCHHTVLTLVAQCNGVVNSVKHLVWLVRLPLVLTIVIGIQCPFALSSIEILALQEIWSDSANAFPNMSSFSVLSDRGVSVSAANCYHPQRLTQLEEEGVGIVHALETIGGNYWWQCSCICFLASCLARESAFSFPK